jgi:ADP-ribose pyrophosphatase YjhB (NUDIX family)
MDRAMISVTTDRVSFDVRTVGVAVADGQVLVTRDEASGHVTLPGGRVEFLEHSRAGLAREMREEMGVDVTIGRLLWLVENVFVNAAGHHHALEFYYAITLPPALGPAIGRFTHHEAIDGGFWPQTFSWLPIAEVIALDLYPLFLRQALHALPEAVQHIVNDERLVAGG